MKSKQPVLNKSIYIYYIAIFYTSVWIVLKIRMITLSRCFQNIIASYLQIGHVHILKTIRLYFTAARKLNQHLWNTVRTI